MDTAPSLTPFLKRFLRLAGPYWTSPEKWKARGLAAALLTLTVAQVLLSIWINYWNGRLFNALEDRDMVRFLIEIGQFGIFILITVTVNASHLGVKRTLQLHWRRWLTQRMLENWMAAGRHHQLTTLPGTHDNPDGRISEDVRNTIEAAVDLAHSGIYCSLLLVSFVEILWILSGEVRFRLGTFDLAIPGHMVWVSLAYAGAGSALAWLFGRPLVRATDRRQTEEANFRFGLARARENSEAIALIRGEGSERHRLSDLFGGIRAAWGVQTRGLVRLLMFTSGYGVMATVFPILIAAPRYIAGTISLGALMQTAQAFQQLTSALSWPVDNLAPGAMWRASVDRVLALHEAVELLKAETAAADATGAILVERSAEPVLSFKDLTIANPDGEVVLSAFDGEIHLGEHVLISGDPGAAVKLFKVVAGLWPWGRGRVGLPSVDSIFFMPERPYLPVGPLTNALAYPTDPSLCDRLLCADVLTRVGLARVIPRLDETAGWEYGLTLGDQQRLGFARLLLHRPSWIFLQQATDALDSRSEDEMMQILLEEFHDAAILTIGTRPGLETYHQRKLILRHSGDGPVRLMEGSPRRLRTHKPAPVSWHRRISEIVRSASGDES